MWLGANNRSLVLGSGGGSPAPGSTLTTLTLTNTSGSTQSANFITPFFGHAFKQGDVPSGDYPQFVAGGSTCPYTMWGASTWPDGSLRFAGFMMRVPTSVAGSGTLSVDVRNGGSAPSASALNSSTITGASDIKVQTTGVSGWSASTWTSSLNTGFGSGHVMTVGSGDAGIVYRVYQPFNNGSDHAQAGCWHYVAALQNASNGLYGLRYLGKLHNGWADVASPAIVTLTHKNGALLNGGTTIRNLVASGSAKTFTWSSGTDFTFSDVSTLTTGMAVELTTTGTLPGGLSPGVYYISLRGGTTVWLFSSVEDTGFNARAITGTSAGSGTHTATPRAQIEFYATGPYTAGSSATYDFIAAGGSGSETTCRVSLNTDYLRSTKVIPSYKTSGITPSLLANRSYALDSFQDLYVDEGSTGPRPEIGPMDGWSVGHLIAGTNHSMIRTHALEIAHKTWGVRRSSTKSPVNATNTAFTNMGTVAPSAILRPTSRVSCGGVTVPDDLGRMWSAYEWSHKPQVTAYAYITTGEPHYCDMLVDQGNSAVLNITTRNQTVGGTNYYAIVNYDGQQRVEAWATRDVAWAAMLAPDSWNGVALKGYFNSILAENFDFVAAKKAAGSSFSQTNKLHQSISSYNASWQFGYLSYAYGLAYAATQDADAKTALEDLMTQFDNVRTNISLFAVTAYKWYLTNVPQSITAWADFHPIQAYGNLNWTSGNPTFTTSFRNTDWGTITNGNIVIFDQFAPSGFSTATKYYVVSASGETFQLSATPGGSSITPTSTESNFSQDLVAGTPSSGSAVNMNDFVSTGGYPTIICNAMRYATALGCAVPAGLTTAVENFYGAGPDFSSNPGFAMQNTF